jgi:hypothetical protein
MFSFLLGIFFYHEDEGSVFLQNTGWFSADYMILWRVGWYMPLKWQVLVRMILFISSWVTHLLLITFRYRPYSAVSDLHHLQTTVTHALGFSVSTSHFPAADLNTGIITVSLSHTLQIFHIKSSLHRCTLHNSCRELTKNYWRTTTIYHRELLVNEPQSLL